MTRQYNPLVIEQKWQQRWIEDKLYWAPQESKKPKYYFLLMFPYPSGPLHCGHWFMYAPPDAKARYLRMKGYNVLFPMGFDAFGLPAENAAINRGYHPKKWTYANIEEMRKSFRKMGAGFNWSCEIISCSPDFYRWTQWLFLKLYKAGLAYKSLAPVDWCPRCNTTLAREQVVGEERRCERCETPVTKRELNQWLFKITSYAEELLEGLERIHWPERVKAMQRNWIGKRRGANIVFRTESGVELPVFTTRPDTVYGTTFMVLAPEHWLVDELTTDERRADVESYKAMAGRKTEIMRLAVDKDKTGVFTGAYAVNPVNDQRIPIWIADYVLMTYGSGAIMGVPSGDQRDFMFAKEYGLPIVPVVIPAGSYRPGSAPSELEEAYEGPGIMVNSGPFDGTYTMGKYWPDEWTSGLAAEWGLPVSIDREGKQALVKMLEDSAVGRFAVSYRLRDWLISRQRYWGAPIPIVYCPDCGTVPVPYEDLPVELPDDVDFMPTGESPLKYHDGFRCTTCPQCGGEAERETDTMDTFVDSSWYWFRYISPAYEEGFMDPDKAGDWLPVDQYAGGVEHATMHLLYSRFITKVLHDMKYVQHDEPFARLFNQGLILGEDGEKMSKSRGNVIDPNEQVASYGADVFRTFLMFIGPWAQGGSWSGHGIQGVVRFYHRVWNLVAVPAPPVDGEITENTAAGLKRMTHQTINKVEQDIERFEFNTAVVALMEFVNYLVKAKETPLGRSEAWREAIRTLVLLLAPFGPHVAEELWELLGYDYSVHEQRWPEYDQSLAAEDTFTLVVQVNGKLRGTIEGVSLTISRDEAEKLALQAGNVQRYLEQSEVKRIIYVPRKLINIITAG